MTLWPANPLPPCPNFINYGSRCVAARSIVMIRLSHPILQRTSGANLKIITELISLGWHESLGEEAPSVRYYSVFGVQYICGSKCCERRKNVTPINAIFQLVPTKCHMMVQTWNFFHLQWQTENKLSLISSSKSKIRLFSNEFFFLTSRKTWETLFPKSIFIVLKIFEGFHNFWITSYKLRTLFCPFRDFFKSERYLKAIFRKLVSLILLFSEHISYIILVLLCTKLGR